MTRTITPAEVRQRHLLRQEIALLDVREEYEFARDHPLFASSASLSSLELDLAWRLPRKSVPIAVYDRGEGLAQRAAERLAGLGYNDVRLVHGGLEGWRKAGFELFQDVNSYSKAFGELVEARRHTPSLPPEELKARIDRGDDLIILDARRFDEFNTMSIPGGARVVLYDPRQASALMSASWLAQMGWEVYVLQEDPKSLAAPRTADPDPGGDYARLSPAELSRLLAGPSPPIVLDLASSLAHARGHVPGAHFVIRSRFEADLLSLKGAGEIVLTSPDGRLAALAAADVERILGLKPRLLSGGSQAWKAAGLTIEKGFEAALSPPVDVYRRPYEGSDNPVEAMQAYLEWEYGLVAQLARDASHGFFVI